MLKKTPVKAAPEGAVSVVKMQPYGRLSKPTAPAYVLPNVTADLLQRLALVIFSPLQYWEGLAK